MSNLSSEISQNSNFSRDNTKSIIVPTPSSFLGDGGGGGGGGVKPGLHKLQFCSRKEIAPVKGQTYTLLIIT